MLHDIIHQDVGQGVMQLEFTSNRINAIHLPLASLESYIEDLKEHGCKVLKVKPFKKQSFLGSCLPKFIPYNCVSLTKQALGIRAFGMITPKRLYLYLLKYKNVERL